MTIPVLVNGAEIDYSPLPEYMRPGFKLYFDHGILPGGFGYAVLCNDLMGALGKADSENINRLKDYGFFLYNNAPSGSYGSKEKVHAWCQSRRETEDQ